MPSFPCESFVLSKTMVTDDVRIDTVRRLSTHAAREAIEGQASVADELNVHCPLTAPSRVVLDIKLHLLAVLKRVKDSSGKRRVVHEDF
jgi:hypothetical protein